MSKAYKIFFLLSILQLASYGQAEEDGLSVIQNIVTKMSSDIKAENIKKARLMVGIQSRKVHT